MKIAALGYIFIEATDPAKWSTFLTDIVGIMPAVFLPSTDEQQFYKMDEYTWRIGIKKSEIDRLSIAGWEVKDKEDFEQAKAELINKNIKFDSLSAQECDERMVREAIRLQDPSGNTIEIFYFLKLDHKPLISKVGVPSFVTGFQGDMGLGHFVIPTAEYQACHEFYTQVLGFDNTDFMTMKFNPDPADKGQDLVFMHVNNPRHHSLALFEDPNAPSHRCVHLMLEVEEIDQVGLFIDRCKAIDVPIFASLGRHSNDLMTSVYVATPGGFALEFGCEGVQLDWKNYKPTETLLPSIWGHEWNLG